VLAGSEQTGGRLTVLERDEAQDYVTVLHSYEDADETLYILEGTLSVFPACGARPCGQASTRPVRSSRAKSSIVGASGPGVSGARPGIEPTPRS
jgi:hypothetical protein